MQSCLPESPDTRDASTNIPLGSQHAHLCSNVYLVLVVKQLLEVFLAQQSTTCKSALDVVPMPVCFEVRPLVSCRLEPCLAVCACCTQPCKMTSKWRLQERVQMLESQLRKADSPQRVQ